jgi:uncharacterized membrane protein YhaH (DUF805 family)
MSFFEAVRSAYGHYATFSGRASRSEFWWFLAFFLIVYVAVIFAIVALPRGAGDLAALAFVVFALGSLIPYLALGVRRLHDTNRSGWWLLISVIPFGSLVLLIFWASGGDPMPNQYGSPPGSQMWAGHGYDGQATGDWVQPWPVTPPRSSEPDAHPLSRNAPPPGSQS